VTLKKNKGFAHGQNEGIKLALKDGSDYVFILNNDTVVKEDILQSLLAGFIDPKVAATAPRIYYYSKPEKIWWTGGFLNLRIGQITNIQWHNIHIFPDGGQCDYLCGCAILVRREVLDEVGLFSEKYFHTGEDADLSLRIRKHGYKLKVITSAKVWHKISVSGGGDLSPFYMYYLERNRMLLMKEFDCWSTPLSYFFISPILVKRTAAALFKARSFDSLISIARAVVDFSMSKTGATY
jgi:GT2 family glycosyltransferase